MRRRSKIAAGATVTGLLFIGLFVEFDNISHSNPIERLRIGSSVESQTASTTPQLALLSPPSTIGSVPSAPPVASGAVPTCPSSPLDPPSTLDLVLSNGPLGFSQHCYYAASDTAISVNLTNNIVNENTGLPEMMSFSLSNTESPAFGEVGPSSFVANLSAAIGLSPTALDSTPISFTMGPLSAGTYYLQLTPLIASTPAILTVS